MNRYTKKLIPYYLVVGIFFALIIFVMFIGVATSEDSEGNSILNTELVFIPFTIALVFYLLINVYVYFYYRTSRYELNEKGITCSRGVLFRKKSFLEYSRINAVNKKQSIIHQIFNVAYLTVDSGSTNTAFNAEILIIETGEVVDELMKKIKEYQNNLITKSNNEEPSIKEDSDTKENLYKFTSKRKLIYSLLNTFLAGISILISLVFIYAIFGVVFQVEKEIDGLNFLQISLLFLGGYLIFVLFSFVIAIIASFVTYYDFRIYKNKTDLEINYGLFVKNKNTFKLSKIKAIRINQGLIKRIFGFVSINIDVIGYGEMQNNSYQNRSLNNVLIPLCKASEVEELLLRILDKYTPLEKQEKTKSMIPFFSWKVIGLSIFFGLAIIFSLIWGISFKGYLVMGIVIGAFVCLYLIILTFILINAKLAYSYDGIAFDENKLTIFHGGFYRSKIVVLRKNIIAIQDISTHFQRKRNIHSFMIHYKNNANLNRAIVEAVDQSIADKLLDFMVM